MTANGLRCAGLDLPAQADEVRKQHVNDERIHDAHQAEQQVRLPACEVHVLDKT